MHNDLIGMVMMGCPKTGHPFATGVAMTRAAFDAPNCIGGEAWCRACRECHRWSRADAWLQVDPVRDTVS